MRHLRPYSSSPFMLSQLAQVVGEVGQAGGQVGVVTLTSE
jgi:hypothetical protein